MKYRIIVAGALIFLTAFLSQAQKGDSGGTINRKAAAKKSSKGAAKKSSKAAAKKESEAAAGAAEAFTVTGKVEVEPKPAASDETATNKSKYLVAIYPVGRRKQRTTACPSILPDEENR